MKKYFAIAIISFLTALMTSIAYADLPENDLWQYDDMNMIYNDVTEETFNLAIKDAQQIYAPIAKNFGYELVIEGDWEDSTVNAYTYRSGKTWYVEMFGGLARRQEITLDAFRLVICHELGHQVGGAPFKSWASIEGQSDYYAVHVCGKKMWKMLKNETKVTVTNYCKAWRQSDDQKICQRNLNAGQSLANLLATLQGATLPKYSTPDKTVVKYTDPNHPKAQCRLDTYLAGSQCQKDWKDINIPTSENMVCDNRPKCWYAKK